MSLYFGFLSFSFMTLIQAFWFVALAVAERIAISPLSPICLAIDSTWFSPTSCVVTWLTNTLRASGATSESIADDLDPALRRLLERGGDGVRVVAGDDDRVGLLLDDGVDDRDLRRRAGVGRALDAVGAAELLQRLVDAGVLELLVGVAELLRDRDGLEALLDRDAFGVGLALAVDSTRTRCSRTRWSSLVSPQAANASAATSSGERGRGRERSMRVCAVLSGWS